MSVSKTDNDACLPDVSIPKRQHAIGTNTSNTFRFIRRCWALWKQGKQSKMREAGHFQGEIGLHWEGDIWVNLWKGWRNLPYEYLGEEHSARGSCQDEGPTASLWLEYSSRGQCGWSGVSKGESRKMPGWRGDGGEWIRLGASQALWFITFVKQSLQGLGEEWPSSDEHF